MPAAGGVVAQEGREGPDEKLQATVVPAARQQALLLHQQGYAPSTKAFVTRSRFGEEHDA